MAPEGTSRGSWVFFQIVQPIFLFYFLVVKVPSQNFDELDMMPSTRRDDPFLYGASIPGSFMILTSSLRVSRRNSEIPKRPGTHTIMVEWLSLDFRDDPDSPLAPGRQTNGGDTPIPCSVFLAHLVYPLVEWIALFSLDLR